MPQVPRAGKRARRAPASEMAYAWPVLNRMLRAGSAVTGISVLLLALLGCSRAPERPKRAAVATSASKAPPSFLRFPRGGAVEPWVQEQVELAEAAHLQVLVYVGASWCEPCQQFHRAVEHGELNGTLDGLRFLEFDQDQDAAALKTAGYAYQYIPVLALPDPDGRNHGRMISGAFKGPNAVQQSLVPRLQALLAGKTVD
jgi:thiol-disulfide isomerase/thioredoxin